MRNVTREEAAVLGGIQPAYGLPTGVIALGMSIFDQLEPPWFFYRFVDREHSVLEMTEDFAFSMKAADAGIETLVDWSSWAGHWKGELIERPG
jgi:hypothetical protein